MLRAAWRVMGVVLAGGLLWSTPANHLLAQLSISPPTSPDPSPAIIVVPVPEDEVASTPDPNIHGSVTLKQRLKETEERLRAYEKDYEALAKRNESRQNTIRSLNESLAVTVAEREFFRRQYDDLNKRMEALGLASVGDNKAGLEERLLQAVNDLRLVQEQKEKMKEATLGLTESVMLYIKTASVSDPQLRLQVEAQLRSANEAVDAAVQQEAPETRLVEGNLNNGNVISLKEEISLVVVNFGDLQGVKVGAPIQIVRGNKLVARARIVDVRQRISGAVIEDYSSNTEKVKVGDTVRVDVQS